ncbi:MAG: SBBP repeat-containing protein [Bryobacteraceae bacterium]|nr:SBBP repeat-containing protein [Bryobacteraceae bacterium]
MFRVFLLFCACGLVQAAPDGARLLRRVPLRFEANAGQLDSRVKFHARSASYNLFLTEREVVVALAGGSVRLTLGGANPRPGVEGVDPLAALSSYYVGGRQQWRSGVRQYAKVKYREVYPGIDVVYYGKDRAVEHDFLVAPGADPSRIRMRFEGATPELSAGGDILLRAGNADLRQQKPVAFQDGRPVAAEYVLHPSGEAGFKLGAYDRSKPLVIDPVLTYSTFLGGGEVDVVRAAAIDPEGFVWVAGATRSQNFPVSADSTRAEPAGGTDIFIAKLNPNAEGAASLLFSTYIGGAGNDEATSVAFDQGNLYFAGITNSPDFPVLGNSVQTNLNQDPTLAGGESDAFVAYLNTRVPGAEALYYATFLGGAAGDGAQAMVLGQDGSIYLTGFTRSENFPQAGGPAQNGSRGGQEAFLTRINPGAASGQALVYSTYFGGAGADSGAAIAVDAAGKVYLTGSTSSGDFPITSGQQDRSSRADAYLARIDVNRSGLESIEYVAYVGGSGVDVGTALLRHPRLGVCVAGYTLSSDLPVSAGAAQSQRSGAADAFVSCFNLDTFGAPVTYSTYLGGSQDDVLYGMTQDAQGRLYLTGYTFSTNFPLRNAVQGTNRGFLDAFLVRLDPAVAGENGINYSGYFGGELLDIGYSVVLDSAGNVYVAGTTGSRNVTVTPAAAQESAAGLGDSYLAKFDLNR